jgi:hypothetical protein
MSSCSNPPPMGRRSRRPGGRTLATILVALGVAGVAAPVASAATGDNPGQPYVSGVTFPFNGVWLDSADGGHYWDASGNGLCRVDKDPTTGAFTENAGTCDVQAKKPTQAVVGPKNADGTYFVYAADMSSKSGGPLRLTYDPAADGGKGLIVAGSAQTLGGLNTVGFFSDAGGNFKNSSVQLGPCDQTAGAKTAGTQCTALYLGFERSKKIERINNVDQPSAQQSIETISTVTDKRKGVRFGIGMFTNANGTSDLYIDELGGNGVSLLKDVANCAPSEGSADPAVINPPVNVAGGCAATIVGGITTNFPQGMAVANDPATGKNKYLYYSDSPRDGTATIMRYNPATGIQDVVSSTVAPYDSLLNPGQQVSTYTYVLGLAVDPKGNLYIGDDPTFAILVNPPLAKGHVFTINAVNGEVPADCIGTAAASCVQPPAPSAATPSLYAYGLTAPKGGMTFIPDAKTNPDGSPAGHMWAADHAQGLCRMDVVKDLTGTTLGLNAFNVQHCDDGSLLGSGGQTVYDPASLPGNPNLHYVYVAQNDHLSPGVLRFVYDATLDNGDGDIVAGSGEVMAPNAGLDGDKANGLALGPCKPGAPASCTHALYMGGLLDGFIRRINNPEEPLTRNMTVDTVAMTTEQRVGTAGKGINGSMGMLGDDLYLPENQGFTVVRNISKCPAAGQVCGTSPLNIAQFGFIFGSAIGVDPDPQHLRSSPPTTPGGPSGLVYAAVSPGASPATVYQYDVATNTSRVFATRGQMPPAGSADATVYCTTTCTRPVDPANPPGGQAAFKFAQGVMVDDSGTVYMTEDAFAGARGGRGHAWYVNGLPYPGGVTPVLPLPGTDPPPLTNQTCAVTVNVPALSSGQTYWLQFTTHASGQISSTWKIPNAQSAQQLLYPGNPFNGLADPVSTGAKGGSIAKQVTSNTASFSITTAPTSQAAGTYTVQFFNGSNSFGATTGTLTYTNDAGTPCASSPVTGHIVP